MNQPFRVPLLAAAFIFSLFATSCGDTGPLSGPGTLTATIVSPNGPEGSAVVTLFGDGVGEIGVVSGQMFSRETGDTVRVVLIGDGSGLLSFTVAVADTTQPPIGVVLEVAGPDDVLRTSAAGYAVEFRR